MITQQWGEACFFLSVSCFCSLVCTNQSWDKATGSNGTFCTSSAKKVPGCQKRCSDTTETTISSADIMHLSSDKVGLIRQHTLMHLRECKTRCLHNMLKPTHSGAIDVFFNQHFSTAVFQAISWLKSIKLKRLMVWILKNTLISVP